MKKYESKINLIFILTFAVFLGIFYVGINSVSAGDIPKCSDGIDNDNDGRIDFGTATDNDLDCISNFDQSENSGHPFLIVTEDMYAELRARAAQSPWKEMKAKAISNCLTLSYPSVAGIPGDTDSQERVLDKSYKMMKIMSGCSLAHIMEENPSISQQYADKIKDAMWNWRDLKDEISCADCSAWNYRVPPGSAFVNSVIAMDIIYNKLSAQEITSFENSYRLGGVWNKFGWPHNKYGTKVIWNIYKGDSQLELNKNLYLEEFLGESYNNGGQGIISPSGAYGAGPNYAFCRLGGTDDRASGKAHPIDIMAFTGVYDFYKEERLKNFYDWLFHMGLTPFKGWQVFGDTKPSGKLDYLAKIAGFWGMSRWSDDLAEYSSWLIETDDAPYEEQLLFAYVLMNKPFPEKEKPKSKIFSDGGASFWEDSLSDNSLMGSVASLTYSESHAHAEANAIYLAGFGEPLILNSGYFSTPGSQAQCVTSAGTFTRNSYIIANGANTVQINGKGHNYSNNYIDNGAGVTEGFTNQFFDYASADSGTAL